MDEVTDLNIDSLDMSSIENMDFSNVNSIDPSMMIDPSMGSALGTLGVIINIIGILFYISGAYGLYLINKKLGEKYAWLSFVPIVQFYNYFTASKKSVLHYLVFPIIGIIIGAILAFFTFGISLIVAYVYFIVMWVKLLHAISIRTGNGAWTTVGFFFVSFIMFPIVGMKISDQSGDISEEKEITENKKEENTSIEL